MEIFDVCLLLTVLSAAAGNEGCFERIAVGRRISADKVIAANVSAAATLTLCKQACHQRGPLCGSFAFGIGNQLEATCDLGAVLWGPPAVRIHSTSIVKFSADNSSEPPITSTTSAPTLNGTKEEDPGDEDVDFDLYVRRPSSVCEKSPIGGSTGILRPLPPPSSPPPSLPPSPPPTRPPPSLPPPSRPPPSLPPPSRPPPSRPPPSHRTPPSPPAHKSHPSSWRYPPPSVHLKPPPLFQPSLPPIRSTPAYSPPQPHHFGGHPWPPHFTGDCFRRVGMGRLLPDNFVHRTVPSVGLEQCRAACTSEEHFRCEGFVYRWEETLCQLTAAPLSSLEFRHLAENDRIEYFARDARGPCPQGPPSRPSLDHGPSPSGSLPGFYGTVRPNPPIEQTVREESPFTHSGDRYPAADSSVGMWQRQGAECFVLVKRGFRLTADGSGNIVSMRVRSRGPEECAKECFQSRLFHCEAFSYRFNGDPRTQGLSNCDLCGQPLQKLDPYQDLMQDRDYDVYGRMRGRACGDDSIMMASFPLQNAFPPSRTPPSSTPTPPYLDNSLGPGSSWSTDVKEQGRDMTVGGLPCAPGTSCTRHPDGGFWGCPVAKGQGAKAVRKDWDYCCRPGHQCGFSDGYHIPWCYVGSADRDQWRPCSQPQGNATKGDHGIANSYAYLHSASGDPMETSSTKPSEEDSVIQKVYDVLKSGMVNGSVKGEVNTLETVNKRPEGRKGNRTYGRRADQARYFRTSPHHHPSSGKQ